MKQNGSRTTDMLMSRGDVVGQCYFTVTPCGWTTRSLKVLWCTAVLGGCLFACAGQCCRAGPGGGGGEAATLNQCTTLFGPLSWNKVVPCWGGAGAGGADLRAARCRKPPS